MTASVLIGWEFGAGLGHVTRLQPVIAHLLRRGCKVVLAAAPANARLLAGRFVTASSPCLHTLPDYPSVDARGRADPGLPPVMSVLLRSGFAEEQLLSARVDHWRKLIEDVQPAVIVADYAPSLILTARDRIPVVCVGNGFTIPAFDPQRKAPLEDAIIATVRRVAAKFGLSPPGCGADLFRGDRTFVFTQKELDPGQGFRSEATYVPYNVELPERAMPLDRRRSNRVAVYLPGFHRHLDAVLKCLQARRLEADIYVPGLTGGLSIGNCRFHQVPMPLNRILNDVRLLIHHGGLGTAHAGLFTGTPQITLPVAREHAITAHRLRRFGTTASYPYQGHDPAQWLEQAIDALCAAPAVHEAAAALQARFSSVRTAQQSALAALLSSFG